MPPKASSPAFSDDQNQQLFALTLATAITKAKDERKATLKKTELKKQLLKKKSKTRIDVMTSTVTVTTSSSKDLMYSNTEKDESDEIPPEVKSHRVRFVSLSSDEIVRIFNDKFKPINLYKLRHMRSLNHEFYSNQNHIEFENNDQLRNLKKTVEIFKNFEKSFYEVYSKFFINYQLIVTSLFIKISPNLFVTLIKFYQKILKLAKLYD
jgi:hypothetical protein